MGAWTVATNDTAWLYSPGAASNWDPAIFAAIAEESREDVRQEAREASRRAHPRPVRRERVVARPRDRLPPREAQVSARQRAGAR